MANRRRITIEVGGEDVGADRTLDRAERRVDEFGDNVERSGRHTGKGFGDGLGDEADKSLRARFLKIGRSLPKGLVKALSVGLKPAAIAAAAAFAVPFLAEVGSSLVSGTAALAHGLGAALALAPAAALAGAAAFGALKIAVLGVSDAVSAGLTGDVEAFDEALASLSPSARKVVKDVVGLKGRLDDLRSTVQERFFAPLVDQVRPLGRIYLPQVETVLGDIAGAFGKVGASIGSFLAIPDTARRIYSSLHNARTAVINLSLGAGNLVEAFVPLLFIGSKFLPGLTDGFHKATVRLAAFMLEAERTGRIKTFIQGGIDRLKGLWETTKQVGRILVDIGSIGESVFGRLGISSGGLLDKIESLTGRLDRFLESARGSEILGEIFDTAGVVIGNFRDTVSRVFETLGRVFGPLMGPLGEAVEAFSRLKTEVIDVGLDALEPILMGIGAVLGTVVLPALTGLANWLADNRPVIQGVGVAIMAFLIPALVAWAINAGIAAINTLLLLAPLILVGLAIAGLAALVIIHFDTIKRWISNVFNWVRDNWPLLAAILTGPFGIAVLLIVRHWDSIKRAASKAKEWIGDRVGEIAGFIKGIPGKVAGVGRAIWSGITSGIAKVVGAVAGAADKIIGLVNRIREAISGITSGGNVTAFLSRTGRSIPKFDIGGVVAGPRGMPQLAVVHGGETVVPTHDPAAMRSFTNDYTATSAPAGGGAAGGGDTYYVTEVHVHGSVLTERDLTRALSHANTKGLTPRRRS